MVSHPGLDRVNAILKAARADPRPFGGLQVIVTGDFYQLPPILPFEFCTRCAAKCDPDQYYATKYTCGSCRVQYLDAHNWAFSSGAWQEARFLHCQLEEIHRQKDDRFLRVLNNIRAGRQLDSRDENLLMYSNVDTKDAVKFMSTKQAVNAANIEGLASLPSPEKVEGVGWVVGWVARKRGS